ncbi:hypothetical protein RB595_007103 [Gaeumannomyces hyphopodioides]
MDTQHPMEGRGLPYELLVAIYSHIIHEFLARPRLVSLEATDFPRLGGAGVRLVCHNYRTLRQDDPIRRLRLVNLTSKRMVDEILRALAPAGRELMSKFPRQLHGLQLSPRTDVFFLSSVVLAMAHPLMFHPGIRGVGLADLRALGAVAVSAREMGLCLESWWEMEPHGESEARMLRLLAGRDPEHERLVVLLGADGVSDGVRYEQLVFVSEDDARDAERYFAASPEDLLLVRNVVQTWRRWREAKHVAVPRLEFATIRRELGR